MSLVVVVGKGRRAGGRRAAEQSAVSANKEPFVRVHKSRTTPRVGAGAPQTDEARTHTLEGSAVVSLVDGPLSTPLSVSASTSDERGFFSERRRDGFWLRRCWVGCASRAPKSAPNGAGAGAGAGSG